jgi:DNA-binding response OmpR family regulator
VNGHRDFTDSELARAPSRTAAAFRSTFTNPILLVDPYIDLGRGLLHQLTRHGFRTDLAITVCAARACAGVRYYRAMVVVADLSDSQHLFGLLHLRGAAPQTWIIVVATNTEFDAYQVALSHGGDACLPKPFQFSDLLLRLESLSHLERTV